MTPASQTVWTEECEFPFSLSELEKDECNFSKVSVFRQAMSSTIWMKKLELSCTHSSISALCYFVVPNETSFLGLVFLYSEVAFPGGKCGFSKYHFATLVSVFLCSSETTFWYDALNNPVWMVTLCDFIVQKAVLFNLGSYWSFTDAK